MGYATVYGRLPRPGHANGDGRESGMRCDSESDCTGYLPFLTLGLTPGDGWGHLLRYSVPPVLTVGPVHSAEAVGTKTVLTRSGDGLAYVVGYPECRLGQQCAAAVIIAEGRDQVSPRAPAASGADERANAIASSAFMQRARTDADATGPGGAFDDQLAWISIDEVLSRMSRAGMLPRSD